MNFKKAFSYIFEDPEWFSKILPPMLCGLIPIIGQMVASGYAMAAMANIVNGKERPLPRLDFGADLGRGFKYAVVAFVYGIPLSLVNLVIVFPVMRALGDSGSSPEVLRMILVTVLSLFDLLLAVLIQLVLYPAQANLAVKGTLSAGFDFKHIFSMLRKNFGAWLLAILGVLVAGLLAPLGVIACIIGVLVTMMIASLVASHFIAQAYAKTQ
ncbi:MAG: DUF4013 domain-containing protein [Anaerolineaceae bacterium]|jgi:hypothetical protein